jgi:hypothetical protein
VAEFVVYVDVAAAKDHSPDALAEGARALPGVTGVDSQVEQVERGPDVLEAISSITLILTAAGGAAGAASLLLDKLKDLVKSAEGFRHAWVQTPKGPKPIDEVTADDFGE